MARLDDIKSIRHTLEKSQPQLARMLGISTRALQSYEQGWRNTPAHVLKLAGVLLTLKRRKDDGPRKPCWDIRGCAPEDRADCPVYELRAPEFCWLIGGVRCTPQDNRSWEEALRNSATCPVMEQLLGN